MKGVKEFSIVRKVNENDWFAYVLYWLPWPLNNQDCIIRYKCTSVQNGKTYIISLNGIPGYIPAKTNVDRISHISGQWKITTVNSNECNVVYSVYSEQKPKFPRWVTDPIIQNNLINTMASMKEISENIQ